VLLFVKLPSLISLPINFALKLEHLISCLLQSFITNYFFYSPSCPALINVLIELNEAHLFPLTTSASINGCGA
jgi:hypothetical protein